MTMLILNLFVDLIYSRIVLNKDIFSSSEKFRSPNKISLNSADRGF